MLPDSEDDAYDLMTTPSFLQMMHQWGEKQAQGYVWSIAHELTFTSRQQWKGPYLS